MSKLGKNDVAVKVNVAIMNWIIPNTSECSLSIIHKAGIDIWDVVSHGACNKVLRENFEVY